MEDGYAYCMIGDENVLQVSFKDEENIDKKIIEYDGKSHNPAHCANTISFVKNGKGLLAYFPSNLIKKESVSKPVSALIDFEQETLKELDKLKLNSYCCPMDFDGQNLL